MTAEEALTASNDAVIRAQVEGGVVSIARSAEGFQLTFIPKTAEGEWNFAGSIPLGEYATVAEAASAASKDREVDLFAWETAPENIVGPPMRDEGGPPRATFLGHPLHPQLILLPAGLLPYSFVMDVMHHVTGKQSYADAAYHTMVGGVVGGLAAGAAGAIDYMSIPKESDAKPTANTHAGMNIAIMGLYGLNLTTRAAGRKPSVFSTVLSGVCAAGLLASAWFGAHLVYAHGMRVRGVDELGD